MAKAGWWERLDLSIPEVIPDDLTTPEACERYVRRKCRELARIEREYQAVLKAEGEEACAQLREAIDDLTEGTADAIYQVMRRQGRLEVEAGPRPND